jgi:hypothetical protein
LLHTNSLSKFGIQDGNRKARTLIFKLVTETNITPKSLFITDVKIDNRGAINIGGFGRVFRGKYKGKAVALKLMDKGLEDVSFVLFFFHNPDLFVKGKISQNQDFVLEVLARRSLSHHFVLPLLGIFVDRMQPFFVSPYMKISLTQWRRTQTRDVSEINELVRLPALRRTIKMGSLILTRYSRWPRAFGIFIHKGLCMAICAEYVF